jgi:hypothetical protein
MGKVSVLTGSDQGKMDTRQRAFAAIMKHNWAFGCFNVQRGKQMMSLLVFESVEFDNSTMAIHERKAKISE